MVIKMVIKKDTWTIKKEKHPKYKSLDTYYILKNGRKYKDSNGEPVICVSLETAKKAIHSYKTLEKHFEGKFDFDSKKSEKHGYNIRRKKKKTSIVFDEWK